jgi:hypothetical protein
MSAGWKGPNTIVQHPAPNFQHPLQCSGVKLLVTLLLIPLFSARADVRLGIVGTGSSLIAFTQILNDPNDPDHVPGARVVAAYRGSRADKIGDELRAKWKVDITPDIGSLCRKVDAVLIASDNAAERLVQIKSVIAAGKPMFIESPLAATLDDARSIAKLAKDAGVNWFSASRVRFGAVAEMKSSFMLGAETGGPGPIEPRGYSVEMLYALLGTGCEEVTYTSGAGGDEVTGRWPGGRMGKVRAMQPRWGVKVLRTADTAQTKDLAPDPPSLLVEVVKFFETREAPVSHEETLEIAAFLDAAERSKAAGGAPMKLR